MVNLGTRQIFLASLYAVYYAESMKDLSQIRITPEKMLSICLQVREQHGYLGWLDKEMIQQNASDFPWISDNQGMLQIDSENELSLYGTVVSYVHVNVLNSFVRAALIS